MKETSVEGNENGPQGLFSMLQPDARPAPQPQGAYRALGVLAENRMLELGRQVRGQERIIKDGGEIVTK